MAAEASSVGQASSDELQTLSRLIRLGDFGQVRRQATRQLVTATDEARHTVLMLVADTPETPVQAEKCILYLFELGADPKAADGAGDTAAHLAARRDHVRVLALLPFDAKWLQNERGATPLMEAARTGGWRCAKHLMHLLRQKMFNECDNSVRSRLLGLKDLSGRTALDLVRLSDHSELASDIARETWLRVGALGTISGLTAQEEANRAELERLADAGDSAGLRRAATRGNCDLPDRHGDTVLMLAARNSECGDEALWALLQLADPTCAGVLADSCLHWAARGGNSAAASALLDAGASVNARGGWSESTPLMQAARAPPAAAAAVGRVLLDVGADWSLKNEYGETALDLATQKGRSELAELLRGYEGKKYFDFELPTYRPGYCPFLERWDSVRFIGRGGFGEVHEVLTDAGIKCAAKTLKLPMQLSDQLDSESREIDRAVESERNLCRLQHDNIVRFFYITQPEPATVVVFMELLDGCNLERFLDKKPLDELTVQDFSKQICSALLYMHSREPPVIHRDINCSNVIVLADRKRLKLIDFGLSIKLEQSVSHISASTQSPKGTLNFMAPELLGAGEADSVQYSRESDIWAFGCSVFQMASGARPFANARSFLEMALLIDRRGAPALPDGSSAELRDFYSRCTAKKRGASARKSAAELIGHEFLSGEKLRQSGLFSGLFSKRN